MTEARPQPSEPIQRLPIEVKPLRWGVFLLTLLSAGAALFAEPLLAGAVDRGEIDPAWRYLPVGVYLTFLSVYAVDRWFLVRRRSYPKGKAFFQLVFGLLFALILLPSTLDELRRRRPAAELAQAEPLLAHRDAAVRAVAIEALGFRGASPDRVRAVSRLLEDANPAVRSRAAAVLAAWSGLQPNATEALREWARSRSAEVRP